MLSIRTGAEKGPMGFSKQVIIGYRIGCRETCSGGGRAGAASALERAGSDYLQYLREYFHEFL